ncbi:hypothetical protein L204_106258 [Cryptococcus depauperatus]
MAATDQSNIGDVYFLSHGEPSMVERYDAGPYHGWRRFGKNVLASSPKGIVVVSAHWENHDQSCPGVISMLILLYDR